MDEPCVCRKISGSLTNFLIMYVDDIQHIEKLVLILQSINDMLITEVVLKRLGCSIQYTWYL